MKAPSSDILVLLILAIVIVLLVEIGDFRISYALSVSKVVHNNNSLTENNKK
jgi:hypothetical protein